VINISVQVSTKLIQGGGVNYRGGSAFQSLIIEGKKKIYKSQSELAISYSILLLMGGD